ncbi:MAG: hypothetical protein ACN4EF_00650 [Wenyingzhuangia sp.]|uniref:hypothetical protein n=1 Tax=Wenyingzhuangia sp. TaxID=1964193 RepID=UPI00321B0F86
MLEFIKAIQNNSKTSLSLEMLEETANFFPYFQLNKTLLLKKYDQLEHFKYNNTLKNVAAHTVNREVLFNYITQNSETFYAAKDSNKKFILEETKESKLLEEDFKKPFAFTQTEKHSFNQWLQLSNPTAIKRVETKEKIDHNKLKIINKFISNNPKIKPLKKNTTVDTSDALNKEVGLSNELMTETLAKVYIAQKKYENAIRAYKILSLKYPEKSSLFADQIQRIKILQNHKL